MPKGLGSNQNEDNTPKPKNLTPEQQFASKHQNNSKKDKASKDNENASKAKGKQDNNETSQQEETHNETEHIETSETTVIPKVEGEQVQVQSITVIGNPKQLTKFKVKKKKIEHRLISTLELDYYERLDEIRNKIDNPIPSSRLNKRRKYSEDTRRNVTFSIREDIAILLDDLVDDAKIFKGLFNDEVMILGIKTYLQINGLNNKTNRLPKE